MSCDSFLEFIIFLTLAYWTYFAIIEYPETSRCSAPINILFIVHVGIFDLFYLSIVLLIRIKKAFLEILTVILFIFLHITFAVGLCFIIKITISSRSCLKLSTLIFDWIFYSVTNSYSLLLLVMVISMLYYDWKEKRKRTYYKRTLKKIYSQKISKKFNIEKFINNYSDQIMEADNLNQEELDSLFNHFCITCDHDQLHVPEKFRNSCIFCYLEFREGEVILIHPDCAHVFHFDCIIDWLKINRICPICKTDTITAMLTDLVKRTQKKLEIRTNSFLRRSKIQDISQLEV